MQVLTDSGNRVLEIDLTSQLFATIQILNSDRKMYLGGKGLGMKLLYDHIKPGVDPLGSDNMIVFMTSLMMDTDAPCSNKIEIITKSPLTKIITSSSIKGDFGIKLKTAGWAGLLIKGIALKPITLEITSKGVEFLNADNLWGQDTVTVNKLLQKKNSTSLTIGSAGENKVRFANIVSDNRGLGGAGLGAVFGAKKLKAIVVVGEKSKFRLFNKTGFDKINEKAINCIDKSKISKKYKTYGTCSIVDLANKAKILPVNNFTMGSHDYSFRFSGEMLKKKHNTKSNSCKNCNIMCGQEGNFFNNSHLVPEYETFVALGTNLGIFNREAVIKWNDFCVKTGMDTISAGGTLAWVMEATQKGIVDEIDLRFGRTEGIIDALESISECVGFGSEMAMGTKVLSEKYGGSEFAMQVKGLEIPAYDPRGAFGQGLAYAVANRGACHLSADIVSMEVFCNLLEADTVDSKPEFVKFLEDLTCCVNSLQFCQFILYPYTLEPPFSKYISDSVLTTIIKSMPKIAVAFMDISFFIEFWTATTGEKISKREFLKIGERIHVLERYMNVREGISRKDDTLPQRLLDEWREDDPLKLKVPLEEMLDKYYKLRGFDTNGIPTEKTLKRLGICIS